MSPNGWGESRRTAAPLIMIRFLTSTVGDQAKYCGDVPSTVTVPQPPEMLHLTKANMLWAIALCCSALIT